MSSSPKSSPSSSGSNVSSTGNIIIAVVSIVAILLVIVACMISRYFKFTRLAQINTNSSPTVVPPSSAATGEEMKIEAASIERFLVEFLHEKPMRFTSQQLLDFTQNYTHKLGSGGFGKVYRGELPNGVPIAVKVLHGTTDKRSEEQFMAEVATIGRTYHINLVKLFGFCFEERLKAIVYEYMDRGSLDSHLFNRDNSELKWEKLLEIAVGTAKGIRYLHEECQKRIIHYDIKPGNILLGADFCPKVADFGLAKLCDRGATHMTLTGRRGTPGYAAPELWMPFAVTEKCDVYSYGMLLFEILGRRRNFEVGEVSGQSREWFPRWAWGRMEAEGSEGVASTCGVDDVEGAGRLCRVAMWCVQYRPERRPTMSRVVRMLEGEEEVPLPDNPFQHLEVDGKIMTGHWSTENDLTMEATTPLNQSKFMSSSSALI